MVAFEGGREPSSIYGAMQQMANKLPTVMREIVSASHNLASEAEQTSERG
ncbi:MAG: hypothetical protein HRU25_01660 [Psychrobium sp.]|nr:hypothetical protein [Psychrobium sp.]